MAGYACRLGPTWAPNVKSSPNKLNFSFLLALLASSLHMLHVYDTTVHLLLHQIVSPLQLQFVISTVKP